MKKRSMAFVAVVATVILGLWGTPAFAHDVRWDGPYDCGPTLTFRCGYVQVRSNHTIVDACDTRADGYGYEVAYGLRNGASGTQVDPNGATTGCGIKAAGTSSNPVVWIRGCTHQLGAWFCGPRITA